MLEVLLKHRLKQSLMRSQLQKSLEKIRKKLKALRKLLAVKRKKNVTARRLATRSIPIPSPLPKIPEKIKSRPIRSLKLQVMNTKQTQSQPQKQLVKNTRQTPNLPPKRKGKKTEQTPNQLQKLLVRSHIVRSQPPMTRAKIKPILNLRRKPQERLILLSTKMKVINQKRTRSRDTIKV
jgi:hypothetical protein